MTPTFFTMMKRAEACRRRADDCDRVAARVADEAIRLVYLDIAQKWREIAQRDEVLERNHLSQAPQAAYIRDRA
jgi:hypothetical protein